VKRNLRTRPYTVGWQTTSHRNLAYYGYLGDKVIILYKQAEYAERD